LRVSVASDGTQANAISGLEDISPDGRYIAFQSWATNLISGDTNQSYDVFVHDLQTQQTARVSVTSVGTEVNYDSGHSSLSADARYVAFSSEATNVVPNDTNEVEDVFVHDRETGETTRVSIASDGTQSNKLAWLPSISADGRFVAFNSEATNLTSNPVHGGSDVFVHDRQTGETTQISRAMNGGAGNGWSGRPAISGDGRYIAFLSYASNLTPNHTNGYLDVFVHDRQTGETRQLSVASDGTLGDDESGDPAISADGRFVAFASEATNLVPGDSNAYCPIDGPYDPNCQDVFVHDLHTGETTRVSVASDGTEGNSGSGSSYSENPLSADGRYVAFWSWASNLVPGDTNNAPDVFIHDRLTGQTTRVSVAADGSQTHPDVLLSGIALSDNGRVVAFHSDASDVVPNDTNAEQDVFVRILETVPSAVGVLAPSAASPRGSASILLVLGGLLLLLLAVRRR
jgi:Tol biopolymer transport system component